MSIKTKMSKLLVAWDLDGTLVDSSHRVKIDENGKFDLPYWIERCIPEYINKDKLLPLAELFHSYKEAGFTQICVTARIMSDADREFLKNHGLDFYMILHRADSMELDCVLKNTLTEEFLAKTDLIPFQAYDDKQENLEIFDKFGFRTFHAAYMNKKLGCNGYSETNFKPKDFI